MRISPFDANRRRQTAFASFDCVPALDETEAARPAGDLCELPRQEVAPLLPVELRRLGEEKRLAREVDAVAKNVVTTSDAAGLSLPAPGITGPCFVGVYVGLQHKFVTGIFGKQRLLTQTVITRCEPQSLQ